MRSTSTAEEKAALRSAIRREMRSLSEAERRESDSLLLSRFLALPQVRAARTILLYLGVGGEIDTRPLLAPLLAEGKRPCLPRCTETEGIMEARVFSPDCELVPHPRYHIPEPSAACPLVEPEDIDLILTPGLAFDPTGARLGQGGGFYDRYLERCSAPTVALCRERFLLKAVPRDPHDRRVQLVLTEHGQFPL